MVFFLARKELTLFGLSKSSLINKIFLKKQNMKYFIQDELILWDYNKIDYSFFFFKNFKKLVKSTMNKKGRDKIFGRRVLRRAHKFRDNILNNLKKPMKFKFLDRDFFEGCIIHFKYTGSNIFTTLTDKGGKVIVSFSGGMFKGVRIRKEKITVFIAQNMGQLIALRIYRSTANNIWVMPNLAYKRTRIFLRFFLRGLRLLKSNSLQYFFVKRTIIRNGIRLCKSPRNNSYGSLLFKIFKNI